MIDFRDSLTFNVICMQFLLKPLCVINFKNKETILTRSEGKMTAVMYVKIIIGELLVIETPLPTENN